MGLGYTLIGTGLSSSIVTGHRRVVTILWAYALQATPCACYAFCRRLLEYRNLLLSLQKPRSSESG